MKKVLKTLICLFVLVVMFVVILNGVFMQII